MSSDSDNWLSASIGDRKHLYRAVKGAMDVSGLSWEDLYRRAIGRHVVRGIGYEDNFRSGRIGRSNARKLFDWLRGAHPERAQSLVQDLGWTAPPPLASEDPPGTAWLRFLERHATSSGIEVRYPSNKPPTPLSEHISHGRRRVFMDEAERAVRIPLGEPFYFRITSIGGTVVSLSEHRQRWMPERFNDSGDALTFSEGYNIAPSKDGAPRPLIEFDDPGLHQFVFVVLKDCAPLRHLPPTAIGEAISPQALLDQLAEELSRLPGSFVQVILMHVLFQRSTER